MRFPLARIDGGALRHNLAVVRRLAPAARVIAVIKANAYGHGLVESAHALASSDAFGVARLDEGMTLRAAAIASRVVLLEGVFTAAELQTAAQAKLDLVVHTFEQLQLLESFATDKSFDVWVKLDSGMNRLGFRPEHFPAAWSRLQRCRCVATLRVMTHLAAAEERAGRATREQLARFESLTGSLSVERSVANSAGLILNAEARLHWVRPGLMLYGISPVPGLSAAQLGLQPAMTLLTQLIAVRDVPRGEGVGYGAIWRAPVDSRIGIAAVGYGDGYPRNMRGGTPVLVNGARTSVVGRVSMDMTAIDITQLPQAQTGDPVTLWGDGLGAEEVAPFADTIAYELVCGISQRVAVEWRGGSESVSGACSGDR